ncbi:hypothetical protein [Deefgea piscis]|uniref:hypothetical protein n=1 Tax=Deefgea piscis TaxID=2739061 RepID=UPI001C2DBFEE|nr:hypothetical protein [Deefgea piscis]
MAALQENGNWENEIYQWETSDPVEGGPSGIDNVPTRQLANRTAYLRKIGIPEWSSTVAYPVGAYVQAAGKTWKSKAINTNKPPATSATEWVEWALDLTALDTLFARLASPTFTGVPKVPTAADGTSDTQAASTAFVQSAVGGYLAKSITGGTVTLTAAEASNPALGFSGTLTSNAVVVIPDGSSRVWAINNVTAGAFTLTVKTVAGAGVLVAQGKRNLVYSNGTDMFDAFTDFESIAMTGVPTAPTPAVNTNTTQIATTAALLAQIAVSVPAASESVLGKVELATAAETVTGTSTTLAVHPAGVAAAIAALVNSSPAALDTLNELAIALGNDPNFATTMTNALALKAPLASPALTGSPTAPTAALGDNDSSIANTQFVQSTVNGKLVKSVAGGVTVTLTAAEAGVAILEFTGALTANIAVVVPTGPGKWTIANKTTGAFTLTVKTAAGSGVAVTQGKTWAVYCDGVNVVDSLTDFHDVAMTGVSTAPTAPLGTNSQQIANMAALQASAATRVLQLGTGVALPVANVGPIWHDDYGSLMTWQTFNANGANYVGYASTLIGNLLQDTQPTPRTGYIKSGTQNLSRTTYAALRAWAMHNGLMVALGTWVAGALMVADNADGTTFRIYDVRGEFPRFWDDGRGVDAGRVFGSNQTDAIRNIAGQTILGGGQGSVVPSSCTGAFAAVNLGINARQDGSVGPSITNYGLQFDASRVVPIASENRSRNAALLASIKF